MRTALTALTVAATVPYLTLKTLWLTGHPVGVLDPAFLAAPGIHAANLVTAGMDLTAIALALVLARGTVRVPAWVVLLPGWVGVGFLVPIVLTTAPALLLAAASGGAAGPEPLAAWVRPLVYGGFTLQGIGLVGLLGGYALRRWPVVPASRQEPVVWARTLVRLAALPTTGVVVVDLTGVVGAADSLLVAAVRAGLAVAGVVGALAVTAGRRARWVLAAAVAGSASSFAWGLYGTTTTVAGTVFAATSPIDGLADLAGMLAGLVAGLAVLGSLAHGVPAASSTPSTTSASKQVCSPV